MGQQCCSQVKVDNGINTQASFNREIEEHLSGLQQDRIHQDERNSRDAPPNRMGSAQIAYHETKDILTQQLSAQMTLLQSQDLRHSGRSGNGDKSTPLPQSQFSSRKDLLQQSSQQYEDYDVRVVEVAGMLQQSSQGNIHDKAAQFTTQGSKDNMKSRQGSKHPSILKKQESISKNQSVAGAGAAMPDESTRLSVDQNSKLLGGVMSPLASNEESQNTSSAQEDDPDETKQLLQDKKRATDKSNQQQQAYAAAGSMGGNNNNNNSNNVGSQKVIKAPPPDTQTSTTTTTMNQNDYQNTNNNTSNFGVQPSTAQMREAFQGNPNGKRSILMNSLANRDDPNSGSVSYRTEEMVEKKKDRKVKVVTTDKRFDTETGQSPHDYHGGEGGGEYVPPKLKGVLKKYIPGAPVTSADSNDSPRSNKLKKKVKFKESTFKKSAKKKK